MSKGFLSLVLHAHLPYVRHPEDENFLEEKWFYEAVTETYIPLIKTFENLVNDGIDFRITLSLSPPLIAMLTDPLLQKRYLKHLEKMQELSSSEVIRTKKEHPEVHQCALMYQQIFENAYKTFHFDYNDNIVEAFKHFQDTGYIEIITCAGTHGYFPLLGMQEETIKAQVKTAVDYYYEHFNKYPEGIWLPECGYSPGHDWILKEFGIKYFFVDTHGILFASPRPKYGIYAPVECPSGTCAFGRDVESSKQVWSADEGYPGDFDYREFFRDIAYELDYDYIKPYIHPEGIRTDTGLKYYRITGKSEHKMPYDPQNARAKAAIHAGNFMFNREKQIEYLANHMERPPLIISPYDAELFGHWWFEGPTWLEYLIRKIKYDQDIFKLVTPKDYLEMIPENQPCQPPMCSWGYKGYNEVWLEGSNDWIYRHLHNAAQRMTELANLYPCTDSDIKYRALNQAARELFLAQASDWAFIMKTGTMVDYAHKRTKDHIGRFTRLYEDIKNDSIDSEWLKNLEYTDNIFPNIDYKDYKTPV